MSLQIEPPLYLIGKKIHCWRCQTKMPVIALLAPHVANADGQVCVLGDIKEIPPDILVFIQQRVPTFQFRSDLSFTLWADIHLHQTSIRAQRGWVRPRIQISCKAPESLSVPNWPHSACDGSRFTGVTISYWGATS